MTTLQRAIPWLDTFQRSRGLEGDVIVLGIGDGEVMLALGAQLHGGERFVIIDAVNPGIVADAKRANHGRDLIIINESPYDALKTDAMDLEQGQYRLVSCGTQDLDGAAPLMCPGGLIACGPARLVAYPLSLYHIGNVGNEMLLTNDQTWRNDYRQVLASLPKGES